MRLIKFSLDANNKEKYAMELERRNMQAKIDSTIR